MKRLHLLFLLAVMIMPWATNAQNTQTFGFEDNAIPSGWTNDANYPWVVTATAPSAGHEGTYCIMSGNGGVSSSTSSISATFTFQDDGSISFQGGCWGEGSSTVWDGCSFYIDNVEQFNYGALQTWNVYSYTVSAGTHTFTWRYSKDGSVNPTGDGFFVDSIVVDLGAIQSCPRPQNLAANYVGGNGAVLGWTSTASAWQICVNNDSTNLINVTTNPYTLTGLTPLTTYTVKVRTDCGTETSRWSEPITFTTDVACPAPSNLTVLPGSTTAEVSWMAFANSYTLQYALFDTSSMSTPMTLQYDNDTLATNIGNSSPATFTWGVKYPASMFTSAGYLTKVSFYESSYNVAPITINVYGGGENAPGTLLYTETVTPVSNGIHEITLATPIRFDSVQHIWITLTETGTYIMASCNSSVSNNKWVENGGTWVLIGDLSSSLADYGWMIRGTYVAGNISSTAWTTVSNATSPHTLTGLTAETQYLVRVKGDCGTDGESDWSTCGFITLEDNPIPMDVVVTPAATTANISWRGYSDSYKVYYRTPATDVVSFSEGFENGIDSTWTIYTVGDAPQTDGWYTMNPGSNLSFNAHGGSMVASAWSWSSTAYDADNWLITPQVALGGTLKYWERTNASYPDRYEVVVSTTGNTIADFTNGTVIRAYDYADDNDDWNEVTLDLSAFSGQTGYIAFHHADTDANYLLIDDISLVSNTIPASAWTEVVTTATSATLTGLTPATTYEYKVGGIKNSIENAGTPIATFTTENGTDSTVTPIVLTVETCDSYLWRGTTYTASTTATDTVFSATGVDSIFVLNLTIHYSVYDTVTVVSAVPYEWNGTIYSESGIYDYNGTTVYGCDSVVTLLLTVDSTVVADSAMLTVVVDSTLGSVLFNGQAEQGNIYHGLLGESVTLTAVAVNNSTFLGWVSVTGDTLSRDEVYTVTLNQSEISLIAAFNAYVAIGDVIVNEVEILAQPNGLLVRGAAQQEISVFDVVGRQMVRVSNATDEQFIRLTQNGVYLVKVGSMPVRRVVVCE